jgi:NitT/TauT family transport system substrate-binding protein
MQTRISRRRAMKLASGALAASGALLSGRSWAQGGGSLESVTLGALPYTSSGAVYVALENGWFREEGLDVQLKKFNTAGPVSIAVVSGDIDIGVTGLTAAFYNMAGKGALKMIAGQSREQPGFEGNCFVASNKAWDEGVRKFPDFVGRRMGNTVLGSTVHYSVVLAAKKYNVDYRKIALVQLQSLPNMAAAFRGGTLDGIVATPAMYRQLQAEGVGHLVAWIGDLTPWQLGALFTSPRMIAERRSTVQKFVRAYIRGAAGYNAAFNQRDASGKRIKGPRYDEYLQMFSKVVGQPPEQVEIALAYVDPKGAIDIEDIRQQIAIWQELGQVDASLKAADIIDTSFL